MGGRGLRPTGEQRGYKGLLTGLNNLRGLPAFGSNAQTADRDSFLLGRPRATSCEHGSGGFRRGNDCG